jgi:hypothetical protein
MYAKSLSAIRAAATEAGRDPGAVHTTMRVNLAAGTELGVDEASADLLDLANKR